MELVCISVLGTYLIGEIFCEIKTMQPNKTNYGYNNNSTNKPANRRADKVLSRYRNKFKKLDKEYAPDVVGDGSSNILDPLKRHRVNSLVDK